MKDFKIHEILLNFHRKLVSDFRENNPSDKFYRLDTTNLPYFSNKDTLEDYYQKHPKVSLKTIMGLHPFIEKEVKAKYKLMGISEENIPLESLHPLAISLKSFTEVSYRHRTDIEINIYIESLGLNIEFETIRQYSDEYTKVDLIKNTHYVYFPSAGVIDSGSRHQFRIEKDSNHLTEENIGNFISLLEVLDIKEEKKTKRGKKE